MSIDNTEIANRLRSEFGAVLGYSIAKDAEIKRLMDGLEYAWAIIVNGQYWDTTDAVRHAEWEAAKFRFRDEHWHPALERNSEVRYEQ